MRTKSSQYPGVWLLLYTAPRHTVPKGNYIPAHPTPSRARSTAGGYRRFLYAAQVIAASRRLVHGL
jgi:hypothetical protein